MLKGRKRRRDPMSRFYLAALDKPKERDKGADNAEIFEDAVEAEFQQALSRICGIPIAVPWKHAADCEVDLAAPKGQRLVWLVDSPAVDTYG